MSKSQGMQWSNNDRSRLLADLSARLCKEGTNRMTEEEIVTILRNLDAKVDAIQKSQATLRPDIIEQLLDILKQRWKDEQARRRERAY
jgi:hypothetical protein